MRRIWFGDGQVGRVDLVEAAIFHAPKDIAPSRVERGDIAVFTRQPAAEALRGAFGIADDRIVAAIFIVGLPGDDAGVGAVAFGKGCGYAGTFGAVALMREAIMPPRAEPPFASLCVDRQHVGHLVDQPFGRGRGRRAKDDAQPRSVERLDRAVEPAPIILPGMRLNPAPREFADAHPGKPHLHHATRVFGPQCLGPMFGVIATAQAHHPAKSIRSR